MNQRLEQLDSLRGLAAISVVIYHALNLTIQNWNNISDPTWRLIFHSPLRIFWSGHQAVIMFFILSGFVLSLPFNKKNVFYSNFIIKRVCRIYIPFIIAIIFGLISRVLFSKGIFVDLWSGEITWKVILKHVLLIDMFDQNAFDPVVWSLVHEMRISLIFPFIMIIVVKYNWKLVIFLGWLLSCLGIYLHYLNINTNIDPATNYFDTMHYILMFLVGAILAKFMNKLIKVYNQLSILIKGVLLITGILMYSYSITIHGDIITRLISDWITMIGGSIIIVLAIAEPKMKQILLKKPLLFLGKTSYSIYLIHLVVFLSIISQFNLIPIWAQLILGFSITLLVSKFMYDFIEVPSIKLGRKLTSNLNLPRKNNISEKIT